MLRVLFLWPPCAIASTSHNFIRHKSDVTTGRPGGVHAGKGKGKDARPAN